eukprot:NODE_3342_length_458_cov_19.491443_g2916_i0.p2 GENE.NODE_3342_length_458_cov_19.491443_g2916_i0~~NODE_3342_length_458_cov_19.491443_g2916_i0.p2  ORF type:complete len:84 (+),score=32.12 NODE_3342_length_458_cov_19.491443_g2916_i0:24-254(+)
MGDEDDDDIPDENLVMRAGEALGSNTDMRLDGVEGASGQPGPAGSATPSATDATDVNALAAGVAALPTRSALDDME